MVSTDLDKSMKGSKRADQKYLGPSLGRADAQQNILNVTTGGIIAIDRNITLVNVNFAGAVTIQLPSALSINPNLGTLVLEPVTIVDTSGAANTNNITILPFAGELIIGLPTVVITTNYGGYTLGPLATGGWYLIDQNLSSQSAGTLVFETRTDVQNTAIPALTAGIQTLGYTTVGDYGGAIYRKVGVMPAHTGRVQSFDGAWWEIIDGNLNVIQFGATGDGATNDYPAFQGIADVTNNPYVPFPSVSYKLDSSVTTFEQRWQMESDVSFSGVGDLLGFKIYDGETNNWINTANSGVFHYLTTYASRSYEPAQTGGIGVTGFARTSDNPLVNVNIGVAGHINQDNTANDTGGYCFYATAVSQPGSLGTAFGMEIDVANMGATTVLYPHAIFWPHITANLWLGAGGEMATLPAPIGITSAAIVLLQNDANGNAQFDKGIVFQADSIFGTDGITGQGTAIAMAPGHSIIWYNAANQIVADFMCSTTSATNPLRAHFSTFGFMFQDRNTGSSIFLVESGVNIVNGVNVTGTAAAGGVVSLGASGADANLDFYILPKGTGYVRIGSAATASADAPIIGYINVKDSGGVVRKLPYIA